MLKLVLCLCHAATFHRASIAMLRCIVSDELVLPGCDNAISTRSHREQAAIVTAARPCRSALRLLSSSSRHLPMCSAMPALQVPRIVGRHQQLPGRSTEYVHYDTTFHSHITGHDSHAFPP